MADGVLLAREVRQDGPGDERGHDLGNGPVHRQDRQEVLVRAWQELEEDCRVDGEVATHAKAPQGCEDADGCEVGGARCDHAEDCRYTESQVEGPATTKHVTPKAPEHGPSKKADILGEREEWRARG